MKNIMNMPLLMTATINTKGMDGLSVRNVDERARQYVNTLQHYINSDYVSQIVFVENSGWELSCLSGQVKTNARVEIEYISLDLNDFPRDRGKGYGEFCLLDECVRKSRLIARATHFAKVTGRFPVMNLSRLLKEAECKGDIKLFCDLKDHKIYDWLGLKWDAHHGDTRCYVVSKDFYNANFMGKYRELNDSKGFSAEWLMYQVAQNNICNPGVYCRFKTEPIFLGKAGHMPKSIIDSNDYSGIKQKIKRGCRQLGRIIVPWFWF